jgi:hypothetical protein
MLSLSLMTFRAITDRRAGGRATASLEMIMMAPGIGRLDTIKIKATIAADEIGSALAAYRLPGSAGRSHEIYFCEQPSPVGRLPLLDDAVILRIRRRLPGSGDITVKLRPCRPGQLSREWCAFRHGARHELRVKGEWAGDRRVVAASLLYRVPGDHLRQALRSRPYDLAGLFSALQRRYLAECADPGLDLGGLCLLGPVRARRWRLREPRYDITAERWTVRIPGDRSGLDLLELSVTADPDDAALVQPAFLASIRRRGLDPYAFQEAKTRYVLDNLAASRLT